MIGTAPDHLVAVHAGVANVSPLNGTTSLISHREADRSIDQLEDEGGDLVFEGVSSLPSGFSPSAFPSSGTYSAGVATP